MPDYQLPCSCGAIATVSTAQAGDTLRCECGRELVVPTMRGLRELQPAEAPRTSRGTKATTWDDRNRVTFLLIVGAITCLASAIYLWASMPTEIEQPSNAEFATAFEDAPVELLMEIHKEAARGTLPQPIPMAMALAKTRQIMSVGIGLVLALGAIATASAAVVHFNRPRRKPPAVR